MSAILCGAWRAEPGTAQVSEASLSACLEVLTSTGASALAWNRIKGNAGLAASEPAQQLRQHARMLVLETARHEAGLVALVGLLQGAGIAPLLFKGRAVAQFYGLPHLRAMGDVDLCPLPGQFDETVALLRREGFLEMSRIDAAAHGRIVMLTAPREWPARDLMVDLHERLDKFFADSPEAVFARAQPAQLGDATVLTPAPEDHLRIVAMHFLCDGGWRPSSLCDVGALLESLPAAFDWELCLGAHPHRRRWIAATCELAHELLGARLDRMPAACRLRNLPRWVGETVLEAWQKPLSHHRERLPLRAVLRGRVWRVPAEIWARWPNGIRACVELGADVTRLPRWPYQLLLVARILGRIALSSLPVAAHRSTS